MTHIVYLLCFNGPWPGPQHYIGITTERRLSKRMQEHRSGKGGIATQDARRRGVTWQLTRTWYTTDITLEKRLACYPALAHECPRCEHGIPGELQIPHPIQLTEAITQLAFRFPPK